MLGSKVEGKNLIIDFSVADSMNGGYVLAFNNVTDSAGKSYEVPGSSWSSGEGTDDSHTIVSSTVENGAKMQGKIQMHISTYPMKVKSPFSLDIPVNP